MYGILPYGPRKPHPMHDYRKVSKETVRIINHNIAANSERFVMGPEKAQLVSVVERSERSRKT